MRQFKRVEDSEEDKRKTFSEADLEGALSNDSLTDAEKEMLRKEEISFQEANERRNKDGFSNVNCWFLKDDDRIGI